MPGLSRALGRARSADDGMTVIEVVVAAAILFFALTALFGLAIASTTMGVSARERALATDTASSYIEEVRSLPYAEVGVEGQNPSGSLPSSQTITKNGMTVHIEPTITWVDDPYITGSQDYKKLEVRVRVSRPGSRSLVYVTATYVRERRTAEEENLIPPTIQFDDLSPEDDAVVWGQLHVGATARSSLADGQLTVLRILAGTFVVLDNTGARAEWQIDANDSMSVYWPSCWRNWDTLRTYVDTSTGQTIKYYPDGPLNLVAEVFDTLGQRSFQVYRVTVDNFAPTLAPPGLTTVPLQTHDMMPVQWSEVYDGIAPVSAYRIRICMQCSTFTDSATRWHYPERPETNLQVPAGYPSILSTSVPVAPFGRYHVHVWALSPRGMSGPQAILQPYSRPILTGTVGPDGAKEKHTLKCSAPSFPTTMTVTYSWSRKEGNGNWAACASTTTNTVSFPNMDVNRVYWYRVSASFKAWNSDLSWTSGTAYSNIAGQAGKDSTDLSGVTDWTLPWP